VILSFVVQFCNGVGFGEGLAPPQHEITKQITVNKIKITLYSYHAQYSIR